MAKGKGRAAHTTCIIFTATVAKKLTEAAPVVAAPVVVAPVVVAPVVVAPVAPTPVPVVPSKPKPVAVPVQKPIVAVVRRILGRFGRIAK
jgi:hypothetical protein